MCTTYKNKEISLVQKSSNNFITLRDSLQKLIGTGKILVDEPMKRHTTFKIGGPADIMVIPKDEESLSRILKFLAENKVKALIIGNGSNMVVSDKGIRGVVIKLFENFKSIKCEIEYIECECGALLSKISKVALENELEGVEFAGGIPGTIGGAIYMNAGAYGGQMSDVVVGTHCLDYQGNKIVIIGDQHEFGYRESAIHTRNLIVTRTLMRLNKGDPNTIKAKMDELNKLRVQKQPLEFPSAGSVFKRGEGYFAGDLIERCNLKGTSVGGAMVSEKHAGFIINKGGATCEDILKLLEIITSKVSEEFKIELQREIMLVGEF